MANSSGQQYQLFGVSRNNLKFDLVSFLLFAGLIAVILFILFMDVHINWLEEGDEDFATNKPWKLKKQ